MDRQIDWIILRWFVYLFLNVFQEVIQQSLNIQIDILSFLIEFFKWQLDIYFQRQPINLKLNASKNLTVSIYNIMIKYQASASNLIDLEDESLIQPSITKPNQHKYVQKKVKKKGSSSVLVKILDVDIAKGQRLYKTIWVGQNKIQIIKWVKLKDLVDYMPFILKYEYQNKEKIEVLQRQWDSKYKNKKVKQKLNKTNLQAWRQIIIEQAQEDPYSSDSEFECKLKKNKKDKKKNNLLSCKGLKNKRIYKPSKKYRNTIKTAISCHNIQLKVQAQPNYQPLQQLNQQEQSLTLIPFIISLPYQKLKVSDSIGEFTAQKTIAEERQSQQQERNNISQQAKYSKLNNIIDQQNFVLDSSSKSNNNDNINHDFSNSSSSSQSFFSFQSQEDQIDSLEANLNFQKLKQIIMQKYIPQSIINNKQNKEISNHYQNEQQDVDNNDIYNILQNDILIQPQLSQQKQRVEGIQNMVQDKQMNMIEDKQMNIVMDKQKEDSNNGNMQMIKDISDRCNIIDNDGCNGIDSDGCNDDGIAIQQREQLQANKNISPQNNIQYVQIIQQDENSNNIRQPSNQFQYSQQQFQQNKLCFNQLPSVGNVGQFDKERQQDIKSIDGAQQQQLLSYHQRYALQLDNNGSQWIQLQPQKQSNNSSNDHQNNNNESQSNQFKTSQFSLIVEQQQAIQTTEQDDQMNADLYNYICSRIISGQQLKSGYYPRILHIKEWYCFKEVQFVGVVIKERYKERLRYISLSLMQHYYKDMVTRWRETMTDVI